MRLLMAAFLAVVSISSVDGAILLYDNNSANQNAQAAVTSLGLTYTVANASDFDTLLTGSAWDLVILDVPSSPPALANLIAYIGGGGKVLMSYWDLQSQPALAAAFEVAQVTSFDTPQNVSFWTGAHPIFNNPNSVAPLTSWDDLWGDNGDTLAPLGTAVALGGFSAGPAAGQAAIVLGNNGRTLYNGFLWDELNDQNGVDFIANQIDFLLEPAAVPEPSTYALMGAGLLALTSLRSRRARNK